MRFSLLTTFLCLLITISLHAQNSSPYWSLAGNSNASATSSKLGTTNGIPLRLFTSNVERLRIDPTGKIGIGTTTPQGKLTLFNNGSIPKTGWLPSGTPLFVGFSETTGGNGDVFLAMASNTRSTRPNIIVRRARGTLSAPLPVVDNDFISSLQASGYDGTAFQNPANIDFFVDGTPSAGSVPVRISFTTGSNQANRLERLKIGSTGNINFNNNQLFLNNTTGNVGLGTATPMQKLHVEGKGLFTGGLKLIDSGITIKNTGYEATTAIKIEGIGYPAIDIQQPDAGTGLRINTRWGNGISVKAYGPGIEVQSSDDVGITASGFYEGIHASANSIYGNIGVYGSGPIGIYGAGEHEASNGTGVYGFGNYGVYGRSEGYGIVPDNDPYSSGVYGYNTSVGVGVRGYSYGTAIHGTSRDSYGIYGTTNNSNSYAGYFDGKVNATGGYYTASDGKLKQNVTDLTSAMELIGKLHPKSYEYKQEGNYRLMNLPKGKHFGLIAQEVEKVLPELVKETEYDTRSKQVPEVPDPHAKKLMQTIDQQGSEKMDYKAVNYTELIPIMVKAMQEQQEQIEELKQEISRLKKEGSTNAIVSSAELSEVSPNPVRGSATINYRIPEGSMRSQLLIRDASGRQIKSIQLSSSGVINLDVTTLSNGVYNYALIVDNKTVVTRKMTVVK